MKGDYIMTWERVKYLYTEMRDIMKEMIHNDIILLFYFTHNDIVFLFLFLSLYSEVCYFQLFVTIARVEMVEVNGKRLIKIGVVLI